MAEAGTNTPSTPSPSSSPREGRLLRRHSLSPRPRLRERITSSAWFAGSQGEAASQHVVEGRAGHLGGRQPAGWRGTGRFRWGRDRLPQLGDAHASDHAVGGRPRVRLRSADRVWGISVWKDGWVSARISDLQDCREAGWVASSPTTD